MLLLVLAAGLAPAIQPTQATPATKVALHQLADDHLRARRHGEAIKAFEAALEADPASATLTYGLACALAESRKMDRAVEALTRAKELGFKDARLAYWDSNLLFLSFDPRFEALFGPTPEAPAEGAAAWAVVGTRGPRVLAPPGADWLAFAPREGGVEVLESATGKRRFGVHAAAAPVIAMAVKPGGETLACAHANGRLTLIEIASGEFSVGERAAGENRNRWRPARLAFLAGGERIALTGGRRAAVWDEGGKLLFELESGGPQGFFPSGPCTASALLPEVAGKVIRLHDTGKTGKPVDELTFEHAVQQAAIAPDGETLAVGTDFGEVHLIELGSRRSVMSHVITDEWTEQGRDVFGDPVCVKTLRFAPGGEFLAACTTTGFNVAVYDVPERALRWRTGHLGGRMGTPMPLLCGTHLTVGDRGRMIWETATGRMVRRLEPEGCRVARVIGRDLLLADSDGALERVDARTGEVAWRSPASARVRRRLVHPSGWVAGHLGEVAAEDVRRFDPKRLRAALAGVALLPPE